MQAAIAGMTIWLQHWYWYPYYTALSLTFTPTVLMGFNKDLKIPSDFGMQCNVCIFCIYYFRLIFDCVLCVLQ